MLVRGLFFEGWTPSGKPIRMRRREEILDHIEQEGRIDFGTETEALARAVFRVLARHVGEGEVSDAARVLPRDLRGLWPG